MGPLRTYSSCIPSVWLDEHRAGGHKSQDPGLVLHQHPEGPWPLLTVPSGSSALRDHI